MITTQCPVCKGKKSKEILKAFNGHAKHVFSTEKKFVYDNCSNCGAIFLSNVAITPQFFKKYYDSQYRNIDSGLLFNLGMLLVSLANKKKTRAILKTSSGKKQLSILDIGSGHGDFLSQLNQIQFKRYGIEISKDLVHESSEKGLHIYHGDFLTHDFGNKKFDCICLWHVIEHIPNPQKLLKKIYSLLNNDGVFIFSTPSTDSLGFQLGKEHWFHLEAPRHIILYNQKSLSYLAKTYHFDELSTTNNYLEFPTDLFWSLQNSSHKLNYYLFYPFYKYTDSETITCIWRKK